MKRATLTEKLTPEQAVRVLRAKAAQLEASVGGTRIAGVDWLEARVDGLTADIALIAQLLADHIEAGVYGPHPDEPPPRINVPEVW
jgi:hypothetical protein